MDAHYRKSRDVNGDKKQSKVPFNKFTKNSGKNSSMHPYNNMKQGKEAKKKELTNDDDCPHSWLSP